MLTRKEAAAELLRRRRARTSFSAYVAFVNRGYKWSYFSETVCSAIDKFVDDVLAGLRPILVLAAPPQHGKSQLVSRHLPAYLLARFPDWRVAAASYSDELAGAMAQDVRRNIASSEHQALFRNPLVKVRYDVNRMGEFTAPGGNGGYLGVGVGAGLTGRSATVGLIDDAVKNEKEALSTTIKDGHWSWYQATFSTRLAENSGQIIIATSWAEDDLPARICKHFEGDPRLTVLRFPAINEHGEVGYNPNLPPGPLVPELKSLAFLREVKGLFSDYWWAALYQQCPRALGGNVFKDDGVRYYLPKDLPAKFDKVIASLDATFKDTDGTDFVVFQVWGKTGANSYLLEQSRARMSFTKTIGEVVRIKRDHPRIRQFYVEDKANGPAVIDALKGVISGLIAVEPDGSKLARAHAVTHVWEAGNVWLPHPDIAGPMFKGTGGIKDLVGELTAFPASANDDQVDALTQALRQLYPLVGRLRITQEAINKAMGRG